MTNTEWIDERDESPDQRMDRNFAELLQELRVLQTGTQILAGFLITVPFQSRFADLSEAHRMVFLIAFALAFLTTALLVGPVSIHHSLFRRHRKADSVQAAHVMARLGLLTLALAISAVICLVVGVVLGAGAGWVAGALGLVVFGGTWFALPLLLRRLNGSSAAV
ncbi:DUF6328 family protein [Parenemella sanctibonifatiensis]|nr:DUF6328 family protein [Parenemella sanctibonifatiensis]